LQQFPGSGRSRKPVGLLRGSTKDVTGVETVYSSAMKNAYITWDDDTLNKFLADPAGFVHFIIPSSAERENVIAYLDTLKDP
jgi:cytochrome c2